MKKKFFLFFAFICLSFFLSAEIKLLSPKSGTWANKQMLVIKDFPNSNGDFFYSLDGSEPESFGFAYDGPVLIDIVGDVKLKVVFIEKNGKIEKSSVDYTVLPDSADSEKNEYRSFVQSFFKSGIVNYSSGSDFAIPENLFYSFDESSSDFLQGGVLRLSSENIITRFIPCTVFDEEKNIKYRFMIKTFPQSAGIFTKRELPFSIEDWDTVVFNNRDLIYKIDSEFWGLPSEPRRLDRTVSHMISWQSLDFSQGNAVEFFVLPPKPQIVSQKNDDGSVVFSVNSDENENPYTLSLLSKEKNDYLELFPQIGVDAFEGEKIDGALELGVFASSVYQGKFLAEYAINRCPPSSPVISSSAKSFYSRDSVRLEITAQPSDELYIALSEPFILDEDAKNNGKIFNANSEELKNIPLGEYRKAKNSRFVINWDSKNKEPVFYKISAYSKNEQNVSKISEYSVIVDKSSYYFDKNADPKKAQGTVENPYTDFEQCYNELKNVRAITLRVKGDLDINKDYVLESNYEIINDGDAHLNFGKKGSFTVKGSTFEVSKCRISNECSSSRKNSFLFRLENAVLTFDGCEMSLDFSKNGTAIDALNSIVNIGNSIVSANAVSYVSFISSVKSRINIQKSAIATSADVNVIVSANEGSISANENTFTIAGHSGRIAELFGVKASFVQNRFKTLLSNVSQQLVSIYKDEKTELEQKNNTVYGF